MFERQDPQRRGKGYALSAGVAHLSADPPDVVVVVDADCRISPNAIPRLAAKCAESGRPIQANYVMRAPVGAKLSYNVAEFAWRIKNFVRPLGLLFLGLPCQLTGSGMAFPWRAISTANLASGNIVEDMALGVELTMRGEPPLYCPDAEVVSTFPTSNKALQTQRRRWEHGHFQTILGSAGPLLVRGLSHRSRDQIALALDLAVPPLTALVFMNSAILALCLMLRMVRSFFRAVLCRRGRCGHIAAGGDHGLGGSWTRRASDRRAAENRAVPDKPTAHIPIDIRDKGRGAVDPDGPQIRCASPNGLRRAALSRPAKLTVGNLLIFEKPIDMSLFRPTLVCESLRVPGRRRGSGRLIRFFEPKWNFDRAVRTGRKEARRLSSEGLAPHACARSEPAKELRLFGFEIAATGRRRVTRRR